MKFAGQPATVQAIEDHAQLLGFAVATQSTPLLDVGDWPGVQLLIGKDGLTRVTLVWQSDDTPGAGVSTRDIFEQGNWSADDPAVFRLPIRQPFLRADLETLTLPIVSSSLIVQRYDGTAYGSDAPVSGVLRGGLSTVGNGATLTFPLNPYFGPAQFHTETHAGGFGSASILEYEDPVNSGTWSRFAGVTGAANTLHNIPVMIPAKRCRVSLTNSTGAAVNFRWAVIAPVPRGT